MSRVLLINWAGLNSGDDFICEVLVKSLRSVYPDCNLHLLSEAYVYAVRDQIDRAHWRPFFNALQSCSEFRGMWSEIYKADRVIIGGGDLIRPEFLSVLPLLIAVIQRKPVALIGVGVVAANSWIWAKLYRTALSAVAVALVRDVASQRALTARTSCRVDVGPDLVFGCMPEETESSVVDERKDIIVNLRTVSDRVYSRLLSVDNVNDERICATLAEALIRLGSSKPYRIILLPMVDDDALVFGYPKTTSDMTILRILRDRLPSHFQVILLSSRPRSLAELGLIYRDASLVLAMRLHAIVPALAWGVPVVAIPYASKVEALRETFADLKSISLTALARGDFEYAIERMEATIRGTCDQRVAEQVGQQSRIELEKIVRYLSMSDGTKRSLSGLISTVVSVTAVIAFYAKTLFSRIRQKRKVVKARQS